MLSNQNFGVLLDRMHDGEWAAFQRKVDAQASEDYAREGEQERVYGMMLSDALDYLFGRGVDSYEKTLVNDAIQDRFDERLQAAQDAVDEDRADEMKRDRMWG